MRIILIAILVLASAAAVFAAFDVDSGTISNEKWRSGMPVGGIGCGMLEVSTDGSFGAYTGNNNWDRPTGMLKGAFAAIYAEAGNKKAAKMLRMKSKNEYAGVDNISGVDFSGWLPIANMKFKDTSLPVNVEMMAWSPLIPNNIKDSSLPVACFRFRVTNPGKTAGRASIMLSWPNLVGWGHNRLGEWSDLSDNQQMFVEGNNFKSLLYEKDKRNTASGENVIGNYALCTATKSWDIKPITNYDCSGDSLAVWQSFAKGDIYAASSNTQIKESAGALVATANLAPGETRALDFVLVWHFPNHITIWNKAKPSGEHEISSDGTNRAFDGDDGTRWDTGRPMLPGDMFVLDMGSKQKVARIVLNAHRSHCDWPRGYHIEYSDDGNNWRLVKEAAYAECSALQSGGVLPINIPEEETQFIRITQLGKDTLHWSIDELEIYNGANQRLSTDGWKGTGYRVKPINEEIKENVGHYYSNYFSNALQIAEYVINNQDKLLRGTRELQNLVRQSNLPSWLELKLINCAFPAYSGTVLTKDKRFAVMESPIHMGGALGTMDQRMAAHAFWTQLFPDLDMSEIRLFAQCQDIIEPLADGRISHFNGNIHEVIGNPNVGYGVTDWPDLSCSFVMQVLKLYRWTGDKKFLDDMWPHVQHALTFLHAADVDGDSIPEGGSTYDYEGMSRGPFSYTASSYLGALRCGMSMAKIQGDSDSYNTYAKLFTQSQKSLMNTLWTGKHFIKHIDSATGKKNNNSFIAQLAGDWLSRISGAGRTLSPEVTESAIREVIARHVKPFYPIPPMETTPEGRIATDSCYVIQHEPYAGCEAINEGYTDDGLEVLNRIYQDTWVQNHNPWNQYLGVSAPAGREVLLRAYMTCPATWHVLNALSGITIDVQANTLHISPKIGNSLPELHMPIFLSRVWLWLDYVPAKKILKLKTLKSFGDPVTIKTIAADAEAKPIKLSKPFVCKEGSKLDLSAHIGKLVRYSKPKIVDYEVRAPRPTRQGISSDKWTGDSGLGDDEDNRLGSPASAYDGEIKTRWSTERPMRPGDWALIDFGKTYTIKKITLDSSKSSFDYPKGFTLLSSENGKTWKKVKEMSEGECNAKQKKGVLDIQITPTKSRQIKIIQNGKDEGLFWSIDEINVYE